MGKTAQSSTSGVSQQYAGGSQSHHSQAATT